MKNGVEEVQVKVSALLLSICLGSGILGKFSHGSPASKSADMRINRLGKR
jgi:hypothetical protein